MLLQKSKCIFVVFSIAVCTFIHTSFMFCGDVHSALAKTMEYNSDEQRTSGFFIAPTGDIQKLQRIIATVNGQPISLGELLTFHGTSSFVTNTSLPQSTDVLREEYALVLKDLITYELIRQDLEQRGLLPTDMELQQAEQEIRATYAMHDALEVEKKRHAYVTLYGKKIEQDGDVKNIDSFSINIIEQGLIIVEWRSMLARQVQKQTLMDKVLRPSIHLDISHIEAAYRDHPELLALEKRVQCRLFTASSRDLLMKISDTLKAQDEEQLSLISGYIVEDFLLPYARLPDDWALVADGAERYFAEQNAGQYIEFITENDEQKLLYVQAILPARTLTLGEAYVRLERLLMEQSLATAFDVWLEKAWQNADIHLIPQLSLKNSHNFEAIDVQESLIK